MYFTPDGESCATRKVPRSSKIMIPAASWITKTLFSPGARGGSRRVDCRPVGTSTAVVLARARGGGPGPGPQQAGLPATGSDFDGNVAVVAMARIAGGLALFALRSWRPPSRRHRPTR